MSKVFSIIGLETNTGIQEVGLMSGIPEAEDIQKSQLYKGEPKDATNADLNWLKSHPEFLKSEAVTHLQTASFAIIYPEQGMQMNM
mgnify:CR=1 FL=1